MKRAVIAMAALLAGCNVDAYCLGCGEDDATLPDGGPDAGETIHHRDGAMWTLDSGLRDGCAGATELCNGVDDDCDDHVDEGIDLASDEDNCGECGVRCAPGHAFGECEGGACAVTGCDVGFLDLDGDPANGCEYRCLPVAEDDAICDLADDDCDGSVDEDVDLAADASNCGSCGRVCAVPHGMGGCTTGGCVLAACDEGYVDLDGSSGNGCEYACAASAPPVERCNLRDDDCDGSIDEGDPEAGGACGSDVGACALGVEHCTAGALVCTGAIAPDTETCDGVDQDCDGTIDEGNPDGGRVCGIATGVCEQGREVCTSGALACVGSTSGGAEACNGLDDDCDGTIDEGNPEGGDACGSDVGSCASGLRMCRGGVLACEGATGPAVESCNGADDDCDGSTDEGDPGGGGSCGTDAGECSVGVRRCTSGALTCVGAIGPSTETCNGRDDDCDGSVDEGDPGGGAACGTDVGACVAGTIRCSGGALSCSGAVIGTLETCNAIDDDCDGSTDEGYALSNDPRNCGACGRVCAFANAIPACMGGVCSIAGCVTGFTNLDGMSGNGCEYACEVAGSEVCNGRDDDCDGRVDESLTPPSTFCNPNGVCGGTSASCDGASGWQCHYPASWQSDETTCDSLDNDCDGRVDESHPLVGTSCSNGEIGACRRTGTYVCASGGASVACSAPASGGGSAETCNGVDDDCDGALDESAPGAWVSFGGSFGTRWIMAYEASRPDATATSAGAMTHRVCSEAGRLPWTNVTYAGAQAACATVGGRLCTEEEWQRACEASSGSCDWSFASSCTSYSSNVTTCNGNDYDPSSAPGDQDLLMSTGARPSCYAAWSSSRIYDLSGNAEEWTQARSAGVNPLRGGSYNDTSGGMRCDFDFVVANDTFRVPSVGFRCCRSSAP